MSPFPIVEDEPLYTLDMSSMVSNGHDDEAVRKFTIPAATFEDDSVGLPNTFGNSNEPCENTTQNLPSNISRVVKARQVGFKRRVENRVLTETANGYINFETAYDYGVNESDTFITNARGELVWCKIAYQGDESDKENVCVWFKGTNHAVVYDPESIDATKLLKLFKSAGIRFTNRLSETEIKRLLFDFFYYDRPDKLDELILPFLGGWFNCKFCSFESYAKYKSFFDKEAPILKASFKGAKLNAELLEMYFEEISSLKTWRDRMFVMLFPLVAMISSLTPTYLRNVGHCLNVVLTKGAQMTRICQWIKVFNRNKQNRVGIQDSDRVIEAKLVKTKDDVLVVDAFYDDSVTYYRKTESVRKVERLILFLDGTVREIPASCLFVGNNRLRNPGIYNLILPENFNAAYPLETLSEAGVFEAVQTEFIHRVEDKLKTQAGKLFTAQDDEYAPYRFCFDELEHIFEDYGYDIRKVLGIPEEITVDQLFEDEVDQDDGWINVFVAELRKFAVNVYFCSKRDSEEAENCIFYDNQFLWIPKDVLNAVMKNCGLLIYRESVLMDLKESGILATEDRGFTCRLQKSQKREGFYKMIRKAFSPDGMLDVVDLGREVRR